MEHFSLGELPLRHYDHRVWDNRRWEGFEARPDDIIVCTPYKAGTTWMQMICALLIFQRSEFPLPLADISHWMELKGFQKDRVHQIFAEQSHRRIIKTHTALDGLPWFEQATYICVHRDPRDVVISMQNHLLNGNPDSDALFALERRAAGHEQLAVLEDINEFFQHWLSHGSFDWESDGAPYWSLFRHGASFWMHRDQPNLHLVHYNDLQADLAGQMRSIARILEIEVDEALFPGLVEAATFSSMKRNADRLAPDTNLNMWKSNTQFFNKGTSGQWQGVFNPRSLALFKQVLNRYPADYTRWLLAGDR